MLLLLYACARACYTDRIFTAEIRRKSDEKNIFFCEERDKKKMRINVVPLSSCIVLYEFIVSLTVYRPRHRRIIY